MSGEALLSTPARPLYEPSHRPQKKTARSRSLFAQITNRRLRFIRGRHFLDLGLIAAVSAQTELAPRRQVTRFGELLPISEMGQRRRYFCFPASDRRTDMASCLNVPLSNIAPRRHPLRRFETSGGVSRADPSDGSGTSPAVDRAAGYSDRRECTGRGSTSWPSLGNLFASARSLDDAVKS
jgi:hypothetical protein